MKPAESIYLDAVRLLAAFLVVSFHEWVVAPGFLPFNKFGHAAVVVFFVLSGYVISYVTSEKETRFRDYAVSRMARIYSVALPALLLTLLCDVIGRHGADPTVYAGVPFDHIAVRLGAAATFTSELWFLSIQPLSNTPFWSLCYEVWYYAIFAAVHFLTGKPRIAVTALLCLICGPKILLLMPIWIAGALLYRCDPSRHLGPYAATALLLGSIAAPFAIHASGIYGFLHHQTLALLGAERLYYLQFSKDFLFDYVTGVAVCCNFIAVRALSRTISVPRLVGNAIKLAASLTFSIYLYHLPLLRLFASVLAKYARGTTLHVALFAAAMLAIIMLGALTEFQKSAVKRRLTKLYDRAMAAGARLRPAGQKP